MVPIVFVTRTIAYEFLHAKAYRIRCEHCTAPYTYITSATSRTKADAIPFITSDDSLRRSALRSGKRKLRWFAGLSRYGYGLCSHCHQYQRWMVRESRVWAIGIGGLCGLLAAVIAMLFVSKPQPAVMWCFPAWIVAGGAIGFFVALTNGPHPHRSNPRSKTDAQLQALLSDCEEEGVDPLLAWWCSANGTTSLKDRVAVSLGLDDQVGGFPIPAEMTTAHVLSPQGFLGGDVGSPLYLRQKMHVRIRAETVRSDDGREFWQCQVEMKGSAPVKKAARLGLAATVLDVTADVTADASAGLPVRCTLERNQERATGCFFAELDLGVVLPGAGWSEWTPVFGVIPETLVPPRAGQRRLCMTVWALDLDRDHVFQRGRCITGEPLARWDCHFEWMYTGAGWQESERLAGPPT